MGKKANEKKKRREEQMLKIELYTLTEAAEILRVHHVTLRNWIKDGLVDYIDVSPPGAKRKAYRIRRAELERLIKTG